jgi:DNA-binding NtrC family response regulator
MAASTDKRQTVMVIDDESDLLAVSRKMLQKSGYDVHAFDSPVTALEHVKNGCEQCIVVISDIRMPEMSGFELVRQLKELCPGMKVILMTAFKINKEEAQLVLPTAKVDGFLTKPFRSTELIEAVKQCASQSK